MQNPQPKTTKRGFLFDAFSVKTSNNRSFCRSMLSIIVLYCAKRSVRGIVLMDKRRVGITVAMVILGIIVCAGMALFSKRSGITIESEERSTEESYAQETEESKSDPFPVYICGEVNLPGIYKLQSAAYLYELIDLAGGLTENADRDHLDMVYKVENSQSIYIPSINAQEEGEGLFVPRTDNEGKADNSNGGKVNLNSANESDLMTLPGIGEKTAKKIVAYREEHGRFSSLEELMQVPGIGESKYEVIRDLICI